MNTYLHTYKYIHKLMLVFLNINVYILIEKSTNNNVLSIPISECGGITDDFTFSKSHNSISYF